MHEYRSLIPISFPVNTLRISSTWAQSLQRLAGNPIYIHRGRLRRSQRYATQTLDKKPLVANLTSSAADAFGLTDTGIRLLAQSCPYLKKVILPGTLHLGDIALISLVSNCPELTYVEISGAALITSAAFQEFNQHPEWVPKLKTLRLADMAHDRHYMEGMRELGKARPELKIELVSSEKVEEYGWWRLEVDHITYVKGKKQPVRSRWIGRRLLR